MWCGSLFVHGSLFGRPDAGLPAAHHLPPRSFELLKPPGSATTAGHDDA
jgi:hypothetical protein